MRWRRCAALLLLLLLPLCHPLSSDERLLRRLTEVAITPPPAPIDPNCTRPPLPARPSCSDRAFTGKLLPQPRRIFSMFLLGFEADTLEIHLREHVEFVDLFCVLESTRAHFNQTTKPLVWEMLKWTERFAFAADKVAHIVFDDRAVQTAARHHEWRVEMEQSADGAEACLKAIKLRFGFQREDVVLSGNADEILAASAMWQLKQCELARPITTGAIWMPAGGDLTRGASCDFAPAGMPYALGSPTIFRADALRQTGFCTGKCEIGERIRNPEAGQFPVLGGAHLTWVPYLPQVYLKELTATEYKGGAGENRKWLNRIHHGVEHDSLDAMQLAIPDDLAFRYAPNANVQPQQLIQVPWLLRCNPDRFPYWYRRPDPRNALLRDFLLELDPETYGLHGFSAAVRTQARRPPPRPAATPTPKSPDPATAPPRNPPPRAEVAAAPKAVPVPVVVPAAVHVPAPIASPAAAPTPQPAPWPPAEAAAAPSAAPPCAGSEPLQGVSLAALVLVSFAFGRLCPLFCGRLVRSAG
eukprot:EG_transcript_6468